MAKKPLTDEEITQIEALRLACTRGTLYDALGLAPGCPSSQVAEAYRGLVRLWHPDRFYSRETGELGVVLEENFVGITRAFRTLTDSAKQAAYNRDLAAEGRVAPPPTSREPTVRESANREPTSREPTNRESTNREPAHEPPHEPPPPKPTAPPAVQKIKELLTAQLARARNYYDAGREDYDAGRFAKAESALYLATKFDPRNAGYQELLKLAAARAAEGRARTYVTMAEQEESYGRAKEAMALYQKAVDCEAAEGTAYYRLGNLLRTVDGDARGALALYRRAVQKEPRNVPYLLALGDLYLGLGMATNALREVNRALEIEPKNEAARALLKKVKH